MEVLDEVCDLLQVHANRDKVVSLTCYALKFYGSTSDSKPLLTASARLAAARACLRLFDGPAAWKNTLKYGIGTQEGAFWGTLGVCQNVFTLSYLQAEKLVFLIDTGILRLAPDLEYRVKTAHKTFWSLFAFFGFIRSIRALHLTAKVMNTHKQKCSSARFAQAALTTSKLLLDVVHSVSWLPRGWLWGSALSTQKASGVATMSAVMGLVIHYHAKRFV